MKSPQEIVDWLNDLLRNDFHAVNEFFLDKKTPCKKSTGDRSDIVVLNVAGADYITPLGLINSLLLQSNTSITAIVNNDYPEKPYIENFRLT